MKSFQQYKLEETFAEYDPLDKYKTGFPLEPWQENWLVDIARKHGFNTIIKMLQPLLHPAGHKPATHDQTEPYQAIGDRPGLGNKSPEFNPNI